MIDLESKERIRFTPGNGGSRYWRVLESDDQFVVAARKASFRGDGMLEYTVVDMDWKVHYNGVGPGVCRSSVNVIGGGYRLETQEDAERLLRELNEGGLELSRRRIVPVNDVEGDGPAALRIRVALEGDAQ